MVQDCKYCPTCDLQVHVPNLYTDIAKAIESGSVTMPPAVEDYNFLNLEDVQNGVRLREPFDALEFDAQLRTQSNTFSSGTGNITSVTPSTPPVEGSGN